MNIIFARGTRKMGLALLALIGSGAALSAVAADAARSDRADSVDVPSVTVRYSQQDLATDRGSALLYARLVAAARQVCRDDGSRGLDRRLEKCQAAAVENAVREIQSPMLAEVYATHTRAG